MFCILISSTNDYKYVLNLQQTGRFFICTYYRSENFVTNIVGNFDLSILECITTNIKDLEFFIQVDDIFI